MVGAASRDARAATPAARREARRHVGREASGMSMAAPWADIATSCGTTRGTATPLRSASVGATTPASCTGPSAPFRDTKLALSSCAVSGSGAGGGGGSRGGGSGGGDGDFSLLGGDVNTSGGVEALWTTRRDGADATFGKHARRGLIGELAAESSWPATLNDSVRHGGLSGPPCARGEPLDHGPSGSITGAECAAGRLALRVAAEAGLHAPPPPHALRSGRRGPLLHGRCK